MKVIMKINQNDERVSIIRNKFLYFSLYHKTGLKIEHKSAPEKYWGNTYQ